MTEYLSEERCRLVLISPSGSDWQRMAGLIAEAVTVGDIASLILWPDQLSVDDFQSLCESVVPAVQAAGIAAIISSETRIAGRVGADGIHVEDKRSVSELSAKRNGIIIGANGGKTRHHALEIGEEQPDYVFFGRFGYDNKPEPHPRNLALGAWWSDLVEIPCVVMAGSHIGSVAAVAACGAEFAAVSSAVFTGTSSPAHAVQEANEILEECGRQPRISE